MFYKNSKFYLCLTSEMCLLGIGGNCCNKIKISSNKLTGNISLQVKQAGRAKETTFKSNNFASRQ